MGLGRTIDFARARVRRPVQWQIGELGRLHLPANYFDVITSMHVIEHIEHDQAFLQACLRLLKPGGEIVMLTPGRLSGVAPVEEIEKMGHYRNDNRQTLEQWVALLPGARLERLVFVHQMLSRIWPAMAWGFHAIHYPFRWHILRDDRSAF